MQDTEFIKHIGKIIRFYRLKNNLTQEQLSEYADCSCGFIGQIERGESKISLSVWACGHFFRPLCLYSFYNLED